MQKSFVTWNVRDDGVPRMHYLCHCIEKQQKRGKVIQISMIRNLMAAYKIIKGICFFRMKGDRYIGRRNIVMQIFKKFLCW